MPKLFAGYLHLLTTATAFLLVCGSPYPHPPQTQPDPSQAVVVSFSGLQFINKGLVAFGVISSDATDATGDTIGGIGSAMSFKYGTWKKTGDKYTGTLSMHPDRGIGITGTSDYQPRRLDIDFLLEPYYSPTPLSFHDAHKTLTFSSICTTLEFERDQTPPTGLDAKAVRPEFVTIRQDPTVDPEMPIASEEFPHLSVDIEGIATNIDGTYWVSEEYGPHIYHFSANGTLIQTIKPPPAILPRNASGALNFTSFANPKTGRALNQGFEGLTIDVDTQTLYALLQSGTIQDGAGRFTRLLAYDIDNPLIRRPRLVGEWVVPLPTSAGSGKVLPASELHFVNKDLFLALSRDSDGRGGDSTISKYKQADLVDISLATDIHDTPFDDPAHPIATNGTLDPSITPATYTPFVNYLDATQLARFGLHNGDPDDETLIIGKWESLALAPCDDLESPNDYFLFTASDNDFTSSLRIANGVPAFGNVSFDNQFMVFRLTLPTVPIGSIARRIGACTS